MRTRRNRSPSVSKRFTDIGAETIDIETTAITATAGLRGDIVPGWTWETGAVYSRAQTKDDSLNAVRESALLAQTARTDSSAYNPLVITSRFRTERSLRPRRTSILSRPLQPFVQKFHQEGRNILGSIDARVNGELLGSGRRSDRHRRRRRASLG